MCVRVCVRVCVFTFGCVHVFVCVCMGERERVESERERGLERLCEDVQVCLCMQSV